MSGPVPVTVIGGYLGAGKTTLVNHLLREAGGRRLAVLVNDFGDLPIDRELIVAAGGDTIDIAGGCVCCSYGSDLMAALQELPRRRADIDHVVLETSGVAMPGMVASAVTLLADYALHGIVVVADAATVRDQAADRYLADTIERQLAVAGLVLLNKADLMPMDALADVADWLTTRARGAEIVATIRGAVSVDQVLRAREPGTATVALRTPGAVDAASLYESLTVTLIEPVDLEDLARRLTAPGLGVLRAKGFVRDSRGTPYTLQVVGQRADITDAPATASCGMLTIVGLRRRLDRPTLLNALAQAGAWMPPNNHFSGGAARR